MAAFLADLRERDIRVWAARDRLRCNAPAGALTPELRDQLRRHKSEILEFLYTAEVLARQQRAIVPLQPRGTRTPVFALGGHNGDVFCYRALVQRLGEDQPFFGLQPPGVDGHGEPLASVEELAAYFTAQIRAFRPHGPCIIAGYCGGGSIAFELARQLLRDGAAVSFLALFGSLPIHYGFLRRLPQILALQVQRVRRHAGALASRSWEGRRLYITEELRQRKARRDAARAAALDPLLVRRAKVEKATLAALCRYTHRHFAGRVSMFLPSKAWSDSSPVALQWRSLAQRTEEYFGPDGCQVVTMLREPYVSAIAELFRRCCEKREMKIAPWTRGQ